MRIAQTPMGCSQRKMSDQMVGKFWKPGPKSLYDIDRAMLQNNIQAIGAPIRNRRGRIESFYAIATESVVIALQ